MVARGWGRERRIGAVSDFAGNKDASRFAWEVHVVEKRNTRKPTNSESIKTHIKITAGNLERDETLLNYVLGERFYHDRV